MQKKGTARQSLAMMTLFLLQRLTLTSNAWRKYAKVKPVKLVLKPEKASIN